MSDAPKSRPSFSSGSRWRIGFNLTLRTLFVVAVLGMLNYIGTQFFHQRFHLSQQTQSGLSERSLAVIHSVTNRLEVTMYYDRQADTYEDILSLLREYKGASKNITLRTVDYVRDPGQAEVLKEKYQKYFVSPSDTNMVIFDYGGKVKALPGDKLTGYQTKFLGMQPNPDDPRKQEPSFQRTAVNFNGEQAFTAILMSLLNPQPIKAYFLGHGKVSLAEPGQFGYMKFAFTLQQNFVDIRNLDWIGTSGVPKDCDLLIIASPEEQMKEQELQAVDQYLHDGGRLLMLFSYGTKAHPSGLEDLLKNWGVGVMEDTVQDFKYSTTQDGYDVMVNTFGNHPVVDAIRLRGMQMQVYLPRPIVRLPTTQVANAPQVDELFASSPGGTLMSDPSAAPHNYPLACAVEVKPVAGATSPHGNTRIVVTGDSTFLGNVLIDSGANRDFLNSAVNWLCDRPVQLSGIGPRSINNIRLQITQRQARELNWLLLVIMPGSFLALGWLVWFVRRK